MYLEEKHTPLKARLDEVIKLISDRKSKEMAMKVFMAELAKLEGVITDFDERLWHSLLDYVCVYGRDNVRFVFRDGVEVVVKMEKLEKTEKRR